jgi:hypothetical protein
MAEYVQPDSTMYIGKRERAIGSLTPIERETIITTDDGRKTATITSYQRKIISALKNKGYVPVEDGRLGSTYWAEFEIPVKGLSFRRPRAKKQGEELSS